MTDRPDNFDRAMALLRRHSYGDVAAYCEDRDAESWALSERTESEKWTPLGDV